MAAKQVNFEAWSRFNRMSPDLDMLDDAGWRGPDIDSSQKSSIYTSCMRSKQAKIVPTISFKIGHV